MNWKQPKVYAVKHKDEATRVASRSGGIFTALSDQVLSKNDAKSFMRKIKRKIKKLVVKGGKSNTSTI